MRRSEAVRSNSALYVDSLGATSDRGSSAAYTGPSDMAPLLKLGRRDRKRWPEPPRQPPPMQHHSPGPRTRFGAPARRAAASAVVNDHWKLWPHIVLIYRWLELCANFVCLAGLLWIVNPLVMLFPFVALWYLPAAYSVDSFLKPLKVPLILFVVDDFSLLGIHPDARNMRFMYIISVFRVLFLLSIIPLCSKWSPIPQVLKDAVMNQATMDIFVDEAPDTIGEMPELGNTVALAEVWFALGLLTFLAAILWLLLTLPMLCGSPCCGCPSPLGGWCNEALLKQVDELSAKVDNASGFEPASCRKALEKLRKDDYKRLSLATEFSVGMQACGILTHLAMDVINTCIFILHRDFIYAALLSFTLAMTVVYQCGAMGGGPLGIVTEAKLSIERGLYTENYLVIVQGDKGVQKIPAMTMKIYGLPFAAKSPFAVANAAVSICSSVFGLAKFIYQQYDLGVEREGLEPAAIALAQADDQDIDVEPEASQKEDEKFLQEGAPSIGGNDEGQLCPGEMLRGRRDNGRGNWTPPPPPPAPWELPGRRARSSGASSSGTRRSGGTSASPAKAHGRMQTVRLDTSAGMLDIVVRHDWAPNGARRFVDLVAGGHFDGLFFYRAVNGCIAQFGLPVRRPWPPLPDDHAQGVPFLFGAVGFVSNGYETRQSTIFICLGDMSHCIGQKPWEMPIGAVSQSTLQTLDKIYTGYGDIREFNGVGPEVSRLMNEGNSYLRAHFPHLTYIRCAWLVDVPPASVPRTPDSDRGPVSVLERFARHHDADDQRGAYHLPGQAAARRSSPPHRTSSPDESDGSRHSFRRRSHNQRGDSHGRVRMQHMAVTNDGVRQGYARSQSASTEEDRLGDRCTSTVRQHIGAQQSGSAGASGCSGGLGLQLGHAVWTRTAASCPAEAARACCRPLDPGRVQQDPRGGRMQDTWQGYVQDGSSNADPSATFNRRPLVVAQQQQQQQQQQQHAVVSVPRSELSPGPTARSNMLRATTHGGVGDGGGASFPRLSPLELQSSPQPLPTRDSHNYSFPAAERLQYLQTLPESQPLRVTEPVAAAALQAQSATATAGAPRAGVAAAYAFR